MAELDSSALSYLGGAVAGAALTYVEEKFHKETFRKFLEMRLNFDEISVMESFFYEILVQNRILMLRTEEN